jgi:SAM-dependent methyltransferase
VGLDVLWHDLECGAYREDLPLWRSLAAAADGAVLDVGAGTGRVALDLARRGVPVVALDAEASLLGALQRRAAGLPITTVAADARAFALGRRFSLIIVPMQTLQLLDGPAGRAAFLRRAREHLAPAGLLAAAMADALDCFDAEHDMPPPPDACEIAGVRYASRLLGVTDEDGRAAIHRRRDVVGPEGARASEHVVVRLDRVSADQVAGEAHALGLEPQPHMTVAETEEYLGSTVLALRAPARGQ